MTSKTIEEYFKDFDIETYKKKNGTILSKCGFFFAKIYSQEEKYNKNDIVCEYVNYIKCIYKSLKDENQGNFINDNEWWELITDRGDCFITDDDIKCYLKEVEFFVKNYLGCIYKNVNPLIIELINSYLGCLLLNSNKKTVNNISSESVDAMSLSKTFNEFCINFPLFNNIFGQKFYTLYKMLVKHNYCDIQVVYSDPYKYRN